MKSYQEKEVEKIFCTCYAGVQFDTSTKVYSYMSNTKEDIIGHTVLVETQYGVRIGRVTKIFKPASAEAKRATAWIIKDIEHLVRQWPEIKRQRREYVNKKRAAEAEAEKIRRAWIKEMEEQCVDPSFGLPLVFYPYPPKQGKERQLVEKYDYLGHSYTELEKKMFGAYPDIPICDEE